MLRGAWRIFGAPSSVLDLFDTLCFDRTYRLWACTPDTSRIRPVRTRVPRSIEDNDFNGTAKLIAIKNTTASPGASAGQPAQALQYDRASAGAAMAAGDRHDALAT